MANINHDELTREQIAKAMACENVEDLMALAKAEGIEMTKDEAEAYMDEFFSADLDDEALRQVAGGGGEGIYCPENNCCPDHRGCFVGDSKVATPEGERPIRELAVGDKVLTLDADGKEIVGIVTEVVTPQEEEIVEVAFSNGTVWRTTASQTVYLGHEQNYMVQDAKGKTALLRGGGSVTVTDVKFTGARETVYDVLIGEEEDEDVIFVAGIAAEGYFTKGERGL